MPISASTMADARHSLTLGGRRWTNRETAEELWTIDSKGALITVSSIAESASEYFSAQSVVTFQSTSIKVVYRTNLLASFRN